ncbi:MAG: FecR domain-containing protein [Acidobacteria bacterium]|nr:FecR domain-containing protein [Acidobacteriota bacterium]
MKGTHKDLNLIFDKAIAALRDDAPDAQAMETANANVWQRISQELGVEATVAPLNRIEGCADVVYLLPDFQAKKLSSARAMLVADHLRECAACRVRAKANEQSVQPWRAESVLRPRRWSFGQYALAAGVLVAAVVGVTIGRSGILAPSGYRAALESVDGAIYRVDANGEHRAQQGDQFGDGEAVRTSAGARAKLRLRDGSVVEMNGRSELYVTLGWRNTTVSLARGMVIVQAAKRQSGHLYVKTADARVAVTGTIFSVNSGVKGSRVSVIEGTVQVARAGGDAVLHAGEQASSNSSVGEVPVRDEISWSEDRDRYLALLAQFSILEKKLETIQLPGLRTESKLLRLVPDNTVVYAGVPNYGDALARANELFQQQLEQSEVLRQWWQQNGPGSNQHGPNLNQVINTLHSLSQFVGNEVVFSVSGNAHEQGNVLAVAEIVRPGLREFLEKEIQNNQTTDSSDNLHLISQDDLKTTTQGNRRDMYVLITPQFVAGSPYLDTLREVAHRWSQSSDSSAFVQSDFGKRIASEYNSGAGLLVAVNLAQMASDHQVMQAAERHEGVLESSGFANVKYLIAQRKDFSNGKASNTAELSFNGPRSGVASWLAAPAPIGALGFISPNASAVGALVSKNPALMVDDLTQIMNAGGSRSNSLERSRAELNIDLRNDLAASLGGEAALALDGPILPTPSWKLVVEVYDPSRLEYSIEHLVDAVNRNAAEHNRPGLKLDKQQVSGSTYYTISSSDARMPVEVHYTFNDGYLIAAPSQALVQDAIRTHGGGDSILQSTKFQALFPADHYANVSGLIYQNLAPVLGPIAGQLPAAQMHSLETIVSNSEPSIICAYGDENGIEFASTSKTLGIDFKSLAISSLLEQLKPGTQQRVTP